jgi:hypothetical protein
MAPRPDRLPSKQIAELFAVANGIRDQTSESERREAMAKLLDEFRAECQRAQREVEDHQKARAATIGPAGRLSDVQITAELDALEPSPVIDPLLVQGLKAWVFRIFLQPNSISALERLLGIRRRPGKRAKNTDRDFWIAVAVARKMKPGGMTLENASYEVAKTWGLEDGNVRQIYTRNHVEARGWVALMEIDELAAQEAAAAESAEDLQTGGWQTEAAKETQNSESERDLDPRFPWRGS